MTVKKSLCGLLFLMMMLLLPTTAAAEELKLPAIPVEIVEININRPHNVIEKRYQIKYNLLVNRNVQGKYFEDFSSINYYDAVHSDKLLLRGQGTQVYGDLPQFIQIKTGQITLQSGDTLVINFRGYPKLKLMIKEAQEEQGKKYWDFEWEILDEKGEPIKDLVQFAKERAKAQIHSHGNLRPQDRDKLLAELEAKKEYRDVYAVYEKAVIRNGASQEMLGLFDLLAEQERLLTEEEVAKFERDIETYLTSPKANEIKEAILNAAGATIPELKCTITAPQTGVALPTEATTSIEEIESCELTWFVGGNEYNGDAQEDTIYTAQCKIKLADGKRLIPGKSKITVNGTDVTVELTGKDGEYLVTYTFGKTEVLKKTYTVTWDPNNGTDSQKQSFEENEKLKLPECKFTPPKGKVFDKWLVDGTLYSVGQEITITEDLTIQAQWKDKPAAHDKDTPTVPDKDTPTDSDAETPRVPEYRAPQAQTVRMRASDGSGTYVEGPAEALKNAHELVVERRSPSRWDLSLRDLSGREVYSDRLMLVTVPVESFGTENLRLLVDGVYTSFSVSEDGKSVTFPAYFTKDGKRPVEDLLLASDDIEVHGNRSVLPEEGCRFVIEKKSAAKFEVNLVNARGETVHTTGPVWISFPAPDGNATHWRVKIDGRETTFEVENGRVRVAEMI